MWVRGRRGARHHAASEPSRAHGRTAAARCPALQLRAMRLCMMQLRDNRGAPAGRCALLTRDPYVHAPRRHVGALQQLYRVEGPWALRCRCRCFAKWR